MCRENYLKQQSFAVTELVTTKVPLNFSWKKAQISIYLVPKFSVNPIAPSSFLKRSGNVLEAFEAITL